MLALIFIDITLREVVADVPLDPGALIVYAVLALFIGFTVLGGRGKAAGKPEATGPDRETVRRHTAGAEETATR